MKYIICSILFFIAGCASLPKGSPNDALQLPIVQAKLDLSQGNYTAVDKDLTTASTVDTTFSNAYTTIANELTAAQKTIAQFENDWLGGKGHRFVWVVVIATVVIGVGLSLLSIYTGNAALLSGVGTAAIGVLSGGIHFLLLGITSLASKLKTAETTTTA